VIRPSLRPRDPLRPSNTVSNMVVRSGWIRTMSGQSEEGLT
jgi:hypothetical protein